MTVPPEAESLVRDAKLMAHLATSVDDRPHVAPVWYGYDGGVVSVLTGGRKLANVRQNPRVGVSIQHDVDGDAQWMVVFRGTATVVEDPDRIAEAARRVYGKYQGPVEEWDERYRRDLTDDPRNTLVSIDVGSTSYERY